MEKPTHPTSKQYPGESFKISVSYTIVCDTKTSGNFHNPADLAALAPGSTGGNRHGSVSSGIAKPAAGGTGGNLTAWVASARARTAPATARHRRLATRGRTASPGRLLHGMAVIAAAAAAVQAVLLAYLLRDRGASLAI